MLQIPWVWAGGGKVGELLFTLKSYPVKIFLGNCFPTFQHAKVTISALFKTNKKRQFKKLSVYYLKV